jgi:hypothetical protein
MALLTLSQYKAFAKDALSPVVIDDIAKDSWLLDNIPIPPDAILTTTSGRTAWTYTYTRREAQRALAIRQVNTEYTPAQVTAPVDYSVDLTIFGGSFELDRVTANLGYARTVSNMEEQYDALRRSVAPKFGDLLINADNTVAGVGFDGLDVALAGTSTEVGATTSVNLSTAAQIATNMDAFHLSFMQWLGKLNGAPSALLVNSTVKPILTALAMKMTQYSTTVDQLGRTIERFGTIPIIDIGEKDGSADPIIPIETRDPGSGSVTGLTDIYAIRFGADGLHAVAPEDKGALIKVYKPDLSAPGAVKLGELEVVLSVALKSTRAAGVYRNIKVQ